MSEKPTKSQIPDGNPTPHNPENSPQTDTDEGTHHTVVATENPQTGFGAISPPGYLLHSEIGRGGMGVVYYGRDNALNRDVAVKVLQDRYSHEGSAAHRFVEEAGITSQLQHPGIPPIHQVGTLPDGRPFLVMKLIKGSTLDQLLDERVDLTFERSRFLSIFEQLCLAVGYAHSCGVIHRDLKPANVMVGKFGEVQVMDWGLAKVVTPSSGTDRGEVPVGTAIRSIRELGNETQAGAVLGTPSFMPPEQAGGEVERVDRRSDVFALGGILCVILTGKPPYTGLNTNEIHLKAIRGETSEAFARLHACDAEAELVALCKGCLSRDPVERETDAGKLAEAIAAFRAGADQRARQAELDCVQAEGELRAAEERVAEQRRRRRWQLALVGSLLAFVTATGIGTWLTQKQITNRERVESARSRAEEELKRVERIVTYRTTKDDLLNASMLLSSRLEPGYREQGLAQAKEVLTRFGRTDSSGWELGAKLHELDFRELEDLKLRFAEMLILMTRAEAASGGYSPEAIATALQWNAAANRLFPPDDRPAVLDRHQAELVARRDGQEAPIFVAPTDRDIDLYFDGSDLAAAGRYGQALPRLTKFCNRNPAHFQAWFACGICQEALGNSADSVASWNVCLAIRPDFPPALLNRALSYLKLRRYDEAETVLTRVLELNPGQRVVTIAQLNRGIARNYLRRFRDAEADFAAALADPTAPTRLYFLRSRARNASGDRVGADSDRAEGLRREPTDALSWAARGTERLKTEPEKALIDFDAALRLEPDHFGALMNKAVALADHLHREADAIPVLDRVLELNSSHIEALAGRGVYLARLGRSAAARADADACLAVDRSAFRLYQMAGLFAQLSRTDPTGEAKDTAFDLLGRAFRTGFADWRILNTDTDLDPIRDDARLTKLVSITQQLDRPERLPNVAPPPRPLARP